MTRRTAGAVDGDRAAGPRQQATSDALLAVAGAGTCMPLVEALRIVALRQHGRTRAACRAAFSLVSLALFHALLSDETPQVTRAVKCVVTIAMAHVQLHLVSST